MGESKTSLNASAARRQQVLIHLATDGAFDRGVTRGIARFANVGRRWQLHGQPRHAVGEVPDLSRWKGDGIIGRILPQNDLPRRVRVLNVSNIDPPPSIPQVTSDDRLAGRLAAEHLLELGLREFAFLGIDHFAYSRQRLEGFLEALGEASLDSNVHRLRIKGRPKREKEQAELAEQLSELPRPVGIFAVNDAYGWRALEAARDAGLAVPEEAAVVGVDNDTFICELADPPLSSVNVKSEAVGYRAAAVLDAMMSGEPPPESPVLIPPTGVVARRSTDTVAVSDPLVAGALRFIRGRPAAELDLVEVFDAVPASRRMLERRFREVLGRTVWQEMHRHRLDHARRLLAETVLSLEKVAELSGFSNAKQLGAAMRKDMGVSPSEYRRRFMPE